EIAGDLADLLYPLRTAKTVLPGLVGHFQVHDLVFAAARHLEERIHETKSIRAIRDHLIGVGEDGPLHPKTVAVVGVVSETRDDVFVVGPAPVDLAAGPVGLPADHA